MRTSSKMKRYAWLLAMLATILLAPSRWNTAYAQTAISFSLSGTGTGTLSSFSLQGSGTVEPYGQTNVTITGGSQSGSFGIAFQVTFSAGSTISATSTSSRSKNVITGTATITGGTGIFAGVTGSYTYTTTITSISSSGLTFTTTGSGTVNLASQSYYFSHLAFGGGWQMILTYINYSPDTVSCITSFYSNTGTPLQVPFTQQPVSTRTDTLTAGQSFHDETVASASAAVSEGWAQAACTAPIMASLLFRFYNSSGTPTGEASVNAETAPTTKFVTFAQTATGVAFANPSVSQTATVTFTVFSSSGTSLGSIGVELGPLSHASSNLGPLLNLQNFTGMVEITSTSPIISLSLNAEAFPVFSSLPPGDLPSSTTLVSP